MWSKVESPLQAALNVEAIFPLKMSLQGRGYIFIAVDINTYVLEIFLFMGEIGEKSLQDHVNSLTDCDSEIWIGSKWFGRILQCFRRFT